MKRMPKIWGVGTQWYEDESAEKDKMVSVENEFIINNFAGIGYSTTDKKGEKYWKIMKEVEAGDLVYLKKKDSNGGWEISRIGIVLEGTISYCEQVRNGHGFKVLWFPFLNIYMQEETYPYPVGAFLEENNSKVKQKILGKIADYYMC